MSARAKTVAERASVENSARSPFHLLVLTSCTGEKSVEHDHPMTLKDFRKGAAHVRQRERELKQFLTPAEDLYSGLQHVRLMRGVRAFRESQSTDAGLSLDLRILSAGYGLVPGGQRLAPYEATFQGMKAKELKAWAQELAVPESFRALMAAPHDLAFVLLGDDYLKACDLDSSVAFAATTLLFCGQNVAKRLPRIPNLRPVVLSNEEATRFSCGLVGLKGEVAARLLELLARDYSLPERFRDPATDVLGLVGTAQSKKATRPTFRSNPKVDYVIEIPKSWWAKPHRKKLSYFIPEWDDHVDPDYDFETDTHSGGTGDWSNEVYAHQLYPEPSYDGILVSRTVIEKKKGKFKRIVDTGGIHRYLRVPGQFPIMGDCGAFGYIDQDQPPYTCEEVLDYYTGLGFDYGVSIDHLIVKSTMHQSKQRYELTINNAEEFLREHRKRGLPWTPIGAVQGWDAKSYAEAARQYVGMGYQYLGLGGLVRDPTPRILETVREVRSAIPREVRIHVFGLARFRAIGQFSRIGVDSIDSASVLRQAWMGNTSNLLTLDGWYPAIRIPQVPQANKRSFRAKRVIDSGARSHEELHRLEQACLSEIRKYGAGRGRPSSALVDLLLEYDSLAAGERKRAPDGLRRTLEERPWEKCPCDICKHCGIEVAIFRGNNRNRRRGFHNTYVFYEIIARVMAGETFSWFAGRSGGKTALNQLSLFSATA